MFKKLRNKFLILNMTIITIFMIVTFTVIYFVTAQSIENNNKNQLADISTTHLLFAETSQGPLSEQNNSGVIVNSSVGVVNTFSYPTVPSVGMVSFTYLLDLNNNVIFRSSFEEGKIKEVVYETALEKALASGATSGKIKVLNSTWLFTSNLLNNFDTLDLTQLDETKTGSVMSVTTYEPYRQIHFLDITNSENTLTTLLTTLFIVGAVMLLAIFGISFFFAKKAIRPIAQSWDKQNQFIADASHEFKTPLAIIQANTDVLLSNEKSSIASQSKWVHYIQHEVKRMNALVGDLLYLAQAENSEFTFNKTTIDVSKLVKTALLAMEAVAYEKHIVFNQTIEENIMLQSDGIRLKQIIMILVDNAIKYSPDNSTITIQLIESQKNTVFTITNAISENQAIDENRIFDRFYRGDSSREHSNGGYGLGLSIAKSVIEKLGGTITFKEDMDTLTFKVTLPKI